MIKLKIKKGATVQILTGSEKGKKGAVLDVFPKTMKIRVEGVRVQTHFDRKEGILKKEGLLDYSNVKLLEQSKKTAKNTSKKASSKSK